MADNYYQILGVPRRATVRQIRAAYLRLAQMSHPDRRADDGLERPSFKDVQRAYEVLNDPVLRAAYDQDPAGFAARAVIHAAPARHAACRPADRRSAGTGARERNMPGTGSPGTFWMRTENRSRRSRWALVVAALASSLLVSWGLWRADPKGRNYTIHDADYLRPISTADYPPETYAPTTSSEFDLQMPGSLPGMEAFLVEPPVAPQRAVAGEERVAEPSGEPSPAASRRRAAPAGPPTASRSPSVSANLQFQGGLGRDAALVLESVRATPTPNLAPPLDDRADLSPPVDMVHSAAEVRPGSGDAAWALPPWLDGDRRGDPVPKPVGDWNSGASSPGGGGRFRALPDLSRAAGAWDASAPSPTPWAQQSVQSSFRRPFPVGSSDADPGDRSELSPRRGNWHWQPSPQPGYEAGRVGSSGPQPLSPASNFGASQPWGSGWQSTPGGFGADPPASGFAAPSSPTRYTPQYGLPVGPEPR
jgi:curved DNA-binding protein CbpA